MAINETGLNSRGVTIVEMLMVTLMMSMVFLGTTSVYVTGLKFLSSAQTNTTTTLPIAILLEELPKKIEFANQLLPNAAGNTNQIDFRVDQTCAGAALATPSNFGDDNWWHYRFRNSALRAVCDDNAGTSVASDDPIIIPGLDTSGGLRSRFIIANPTGVGITTVVDVLMMTSAAPLQTTQTSFVIGAQAKR